MSVDVETLFLLLMAFQVKHFISDFPLQTDFMLQKVRDGVAWVLPLTIHCLVHALFTLFICLYIRPEYWWLALLDFVVHFIMDRIKASPHMLGRYNNNESSAYWNCLGVDQMVHHFTHYYIAWYLLFN